MQRQDFKKTDDMFNRVLGKDHIAIVCLLENIHTGTRFVIANAHIHWDPAYRDVKLVQVALLVDEVDKLAEHFAKYPPPAPPGLHGPAAQAPDASSKPANGIDDDSDAASTSSPEEPAPQPQSQAPAAYRPPPTYTDGLKIPVIICGDFNSVPESGVYELLSNGSVLGTHEDFMAHKYGRYTSEGIRHRLGLKSAYAPVAPDLPVTNYTPSFQGHIDYVWYSAGNLSVNRVLIGGRPCVSRQGRRVPAPAFPVRVCPCMIIYL